MDEKFVAQGAKSDFTREELLKLLSYLEGEIQARDIVIATLKVTSAINLIDFIKKNSLNK